MIVFKQKEYSEYEAMRSLYTELMRNGGQRGMWETINKSQLIPILKGNNIVVEKFVISTSMFGKDKFRMYIKIGAKAKLPDEVRLTGYYYDDRLGKYAFKVRNGIPHKKDFNEQKEFGDKKPKGPGNFMEGSFEYFGELQVEVHKLLGEAIKYDKRARELILEFDTIQDAIRALNVLPFGLHYKIYLLDS